MYRLDFYLDNSMDFKNILGDKDRNINALSYYFNTKIVVSKDEIYIENYDLKDRLEVLFSCLTRLSSMNVNLRERDVVYIAQLLETKEIEDVIDFYKKRKEIVKNFSGKSIYPKTISQEFYLKELDKNDCIISYGVAGVGKTYIAVCDAVKNFKAGRFNKIILSRPIVEAGESLGFLPGEIKEKVDPYLIPLYDALYELLGKRATEDYIENGIIEIAPLAYMRGRTLENAYIILDEAQNTTVKQMKLFLTRLGFNSKMVITGDLTQIDLKQGLESGLSYAVNHLDNIPGLKIHKFELKDVVRNPLVEKMLERFSDD